MTTIMAAWLLDSNLFQTTSQWQDKFEKLLWTGGRYSVPIIYEPNTYAIIFMR